MIYLLLTLDQGDYQNASVYGRITQIDMSRKSTAATSSDALAEGCLALRNCWRIS